MNSLSCYNASSADMSEDDPDENLSPNGDSEDEKEFAEEYDTVGI